MHGCLGAALVYWPAPPRQAAAPAGALQVRLVAPRVTAAAPDVAQAPVAVIPEAKPAPVPSVDERASAVSAPPAAADLPAVEPVHINYYLPSELDERPRLAEDVNPDLPVSILDVPAQDLVLRLMINGEGGVDEVIIEGKQPRDTVRIAVLQAFRQLKFVPGKVRGVMVNSQMRIQVHLDEPMHVMPSTVVH